MNKGDQARQEWAARAEKIGLFRYQVIQDLIDPELTAKQRGVLARAAAERGHLGVDGQPAQVSRQTIDRWLRWWRIGGFDALVPRPANVTARTPAEVVELALALKREQPARTGEQVRRILLKSIGNAPSARTLQRYFAELIFDEDFEDQRDQHFGRFEAAVSNELWTGDAMHGVVIDGHKAILFCFIDDHSRAVMGGRWGYREDVVRLAAALRPALAARGVPKAIYVDNGSAFVDAWLLRACATLGIKLVHSVPGRPQGRGKIERFFRTVRSQFLVELEGPNAPQPANLSELNRLFSAWVETVYHHRTHSQTGAPPLRRWQDDLPQPSTLPTPSQLSEAFRWSARRRVAKTATVSLHRNEYEVAAHLAGHYVELVFDPFDLTDIDVRIGGKPAGKATPFKIGRHSHPKAQPERPGRNDDDLPPPTGINYLNLLDATRKARQGEHINYSALFTTDQAASDGDGDDRHDTGGRP